MRLLDERVELVDVTLGVRILHDDRYNEKNVLVKSQLPLILIVCPTLQVNDTFCLLTGHIAIEVGPVAIELHELNVERTGARLEKCDVLRV